MGRLLGPEDYPPQEESGRPAGIAYRREALRRASQIDGLDFSYGKDIYQRVALFPSPQPNGTVLAFMHGGAWNSGCKELMAFMAPALLEQGVTFASLGYRLAPAHLFPAGFEDAASALGWLHAHVRQYGGNPERIFVGGFSAGGHYAALLAVRRDWQAAHALPRDVIRGCLPVSAPYDLTPAGGSASHPSLLGPAQSRNDRLASPLYSIQGRPPPFFMAHGDQDFPHIMSQAPRMQAALKAAGGQCERIVFEGCDHFTSSLSAVDPQKQWRAGSVDWMLRH